MSDDDRFLDVEGLGVLSTAAFQLHSFALVESMQRGTPGFVSDDYLESIAAETSITAVELETAGLWVRREGGYFVNDNETVGKLLEFNEQSDAKAAECAARGFHTPDDEGGAWIVCTNCFVPLQRPDGKAVGGPNGEPPDYGPSRRDGLDKL